MVYRVDERAFDLQSLSAGPAITNAKLPQNYLGVFLQAILYANIQPSPARNDPDAYVTIRGEYQIGVLGFAEIRRTVRQSLHIASRGAPN